ncbi:DegV family protein with EDD domain [Clostridium tetanomorphum]|uniref:DegV family protein n=1 Tax=Clostridium tetanomorphum TaxID=1553 RepID=UPI0004518812|nr:DegV family protein [Clostridium tetanomorphum]KAJ53141.1 degV family protein [Clostridium tetanomorphum DSM 665]MBP1863097.1 DegV family protein with EDD domain [Clostridium tetanomorphum]NRS84206.1 DegV family protein with EDD domain [Clostridium tetanomorphum]SQB92530.1 degV family protein [Clostridium tetanomorphum]
MEKIALITDTTADLSEDIIKRYNVNVLPFRIIYKDREYKDKLEISPKEVYRNFEKEVPTSSLPSIQDMEDLFYKLEEQKFTHAIAITLSSGLSGIYNAVKLVSDNHPNINTFVCDSQSISAGEGMIVEECGEMIKNGKSFDEIVNEIPNIKKRINLFFVVGTLEYLKKGGRIGRVSGTIGELLNIKPIISVDAKDGKYYTFDKVRGRKQSINRLIEIIKGILKEKKCKICVVHGDALEESNKLFETIKTMDNVSEAYLGGEISPVSGVHSGPGLIGVVLKEELT